MRADIGEAWTNRIIPHRAKPSGLGAERSPPPERDDAGDNHAQPGALDEDQRSEDEFVVLPRLHASGVKQKCRHADSSRGGVPRWNGLDIASVTRSD